MAKSTTNKWKITYFNITKQKNMKKDLPSRAAVNAFVKKKALKAYGIWQLYLSVDKTISKP